MAKRFDERLPPAPRKVGELPKVQDALGYLEKVKNRFQNQPHVYNRFLDIMKDFKSQTIDTEGVIERVKELFVGDAQLILGFNQFLPPGFKINIEDTYPPPIAPNPKAPIEFNHAVQYVAKIKNRFKDEPDIYSEFLDILHDYQAKRTIDEVYGRVQKLFDNQPDLLDEFKCFLPDDVRGYDVAMDGNVPKMKPRSGKDLDKKRKESSPPPKMAPAAGEKAVLFDNIKETIGRNHWVQFIKCLDMYAHRICTREELLRLVEGLLGSPVLLKQFKDVLGFNITLETQTSYYDFVHSPDAVAQCKQLTPSYKQYPRGLKEPLCTGQTQDIQQVLNKTCFAVASAKGREGRKRRQLNIHEAELSSIEDQRISLDVMIHNNTAAIKELELYLKQLASDDDNGRSPPPASLGVLQQRSIARLYGDKGAEMLELLRKSPLDTVPMLLTRLRQKDEEWRRCKSELSHKWAEGTREHSRDALDYQTAFVKEKLRRKCNAQTLVAELKRNAKDNLCLPISCSPSIHHSIHSTINSLALTHLVCAKQRNLVHSLWQTVLHPFFGVDPLPVHLMRVVVSPTFSALSPPSTTLIPLIPPTPPPSSLASPLTQIKILPPPIPLPPMPTFSLGPSVKIELSSSTTPSTTTTSSITTTTATTTTAVTISFTTTTPSTPVVEDVFLAKAEKIDLTTGSQSPSPKKKPRAKRGKRRAPVRRVAKNKASKLSKDAGRGDVEDDSDEDEDYASEEKHDAVSSSSNIPTPTTKTSSSTSSSPAASSFRVKTELSPPMPSLPPSASPLSSSPSSSPPPPSASPPPPILSAPASMELLDSLSLPHKVKRETSAPNSLRLSSRRSFGSPDHHTQANPIREVCAVSFSAAHKPYHTEPISYGGNAPACLYASTGVYAVVRLHLFVAQVFQQACSTMGALKWTQFLSLLEKRIAGEVQDTWGPQLAKLLGSTPSTALLTVDCLVVELLRQAARVISDETCLKELSFYAAHLNASENRKTLGTHSYEELFMELRGKEFYTTLSCANSNVLCRVPAAFSLPSPTIPKLEPPSIWNNYTRRHLLLFPHLKQASPSLRPFLMRCLKRTGSFDGETRNVSNSLNNNTNPNPSFSEFAPDPFSPSRNVSLESSSNSYDSLNSNNNSSENNNFQENNSGSNSNNDMNNNYRCEEDEESLCVEGSLSPLIARKEDEEDGSTSGDEASELSRNVEVYKHRALTRWREFCKDQAYNPDLPRMFHQAALDRRSRIINDNHRRIDRWRTLHANMMGSQMEDV